MNHRWKNWKKKKKESSKSGKPCLTPEAMPFYRAICYLSLGEAASHQACLCPINTLWTPLGKSSKKFKLTHQTNHTVRIRKLLLLFLHSSLPGYLSCEMKDTDSKFNLIQRRRKTHQLSDHRDLKTKVKFIRMLRETI